MSNIKTTFPNTTVPQQELDSQQSNNSNNSCDVYIPDYSILRQKNLDKINNYYDKLLSSYSSTYVDYATQSKGTKNDQNYANTVLLPKYTNFNKQLITLNQTMINNVNQDMDLIAAQKDELLTKTKQIDTIMNNIKMLKDKDNEMNVLTGSRQNSLSSVDEGLSDLNYTTYLYIGLNILILFMVLGIIIYIVYSQFTSNRNRSMNTLYNNIAVNNTSKYYKHPPTI